MMGLPFSNYTHEDEPFAQELFNEQTSLPQVDDDEPLVDPGDYNAAARSHRDFSGVATYRRS